MANFVGTLADLAYPKAMLSQLQDTTYMLALEDGIRAALEEQPGKLPDNPEQPEHICSVTSCVARAIESGSALPVLTTVTVLLVLAQTLAAA